MVLDELKSEGVDVIISYLPVWEFCFSMHVLSEPDHHLYREKWVRKIEEKFPELVLRIREYSERTCQWTLFIDVPSWGEIRQLEIPDFLLFLRRQDICQWNRIIKPLERKISSQERKELLEIFRVYYEQVFQREELILRAYLVRILQREKEYCMRKGIWEWVFLANKDIKKATTIITTAIYKFNVLSNIPAIIYAKLNAFKSKLINNKFLSFVSYFILRSSKKVLLPNKAFFIALCKKSIILSICFINFLKIL